MMLPGKDFVGVGVGALIVRDGRALMLLRSDKCRNNAGMWTVPGGMVEVFEKLEDAAVREVEEEAGLKTTSIKFLTVSDRIFDGQHWVSILYICETAGEPANMEKDKHLKMEWLDIKNLPDNITAPSMDGIRAYLAIMH